MTPAQCSNDSPRRGGSSTQAAPADKDPKGITYDEYQQRIKQVTGKLIQDYPNMDDMWKMYG